MRLNWVDGVMVAVIAYHVAEGWAEDVFQLGGELVSFLGSLWLAVHFHREAGGFLAAKFGLPSVWANVTGFVAVALLAQVVIDSVWGWIRLHWPQKIQNEPIGRWLAVALGDGQGDSFNHYCPVGDFGVAHQRQCQGRHPVFRIGVEIGAGGGKVWWRSQVRIGADGKRDGEVSHR